MKIKFYFLLSIVFVFSFAAHGQSASISTRSITYTRPRPLSDDKAKIIVEYPRVRVRSRAISRRIERNISFARVLKIDIAREINGRDQWLDTVAVDVNCNENGILSVTVWASGSGHFASTMSRNVLIDLKTGDVVTARQIFKDLPGLAALVKNYQRAEMKRATAEIINMEGYADFDAGKWFGMADFTPQNLENFIISPLGITFTYDYGFPRIMLSVQPSGLFYVQWHELEPFIRRGGLLGKFVY